MCGNRGRSGVTICLLLVYLVLDVTGALAQGHSSGTPDQSGPHSSSQTLSHPFVSGVVQDQTGALLGGAQVELRSGSDKIQSATTDDSGTFKFIDVPSGNYSVHIEHEGFDAKDIPLHFGGESPAPLRIVLAITGVSQETTVTADSTVVSTDSGDNQNSNSLSGQALTNVPVFDQDYVATMSRFLDDGATGTNGAPLIVDGVEVNDLGVSGSAIKEVKINNDPYSAEFSRPGRGRIEVITKKRID